MILNDWNVRNALCFLCFLLMAACSQDGTESVQEAADCPPAPEVRAAQQLDTLNIIIETSGSMAGFMPSRGGTQTDFQRQIDNLLANAESMEGKGIRTIRYYSARERMYKEVYSRFSQVLRHGLRNAGSSSPIPQMLNNIAGSYIGEEQVSVFISDFIYAPPDRRDRDFIANDIRRALGSLKEGMVLSVFASQSDFSGIFYPAGSLDGRAGQPIRNCCDTKIPYYVWVIGPEEKVRLVNQDVIRGGFFEQLHFGFPVREPGYRIIPGSGREGNWYPIDQEGKVIKLDNPRDIRKENVTFTIGLALEGLPGHMADVEYLQHNLRLRMLNAEATLEEVYDRQAFTSTENINNKDRRLLDCFSHYVKISVNKVFDPNQNIEANLILDNKLPTWVEDYTTANDTRIEEEGPRTFSLNAILEGAGMATEGQDGAAFNLSTTIDLSR